MTGVVVVLAIPPTALAFAWRAAFTEEPTTIAKWRRRLLTGGLVLASASVAFVTFVIVAGNLEMPWGVRVLTVRWAPIGVPCAFVGLMLCLFGAGRARLWAVVGTCVALFYWFILIQSM